MTTLPTTPTLEDAIALAVEAHRGQTYPIPGGAPFILHPLRVMLHVESPAARIVAVLHDLIKDTPHSLADLRPVATPPPPSAPPSISSLTVTRTPTTPTSPASPPTRSLAALSSPTSR